jgi:hypothetical protein
VSNPAILGALFDQGASTKSVMIQGGGGVDATFSQTELPPPGGFMTTYPVQGTPVYIDGGTDVEISNFSFDGGSRDNVNYIMLTLNGVNGAWIHHLDFQNVIGGMYLYNCSNVVVENCRGRNVGDWTIGSGHSNYIQYAESYGGAVRNCTFLGGRTEDMLSTWHSGGVTFEHNHVENYLVDQQYARSWVGSTSGTGTIMSDGMGAGGNGNVTVRYSTYLNCGQVGIQFIDGPNLHAYNNTLIQMPCPGSNQPYSSWEGFPVGSCHDNQARWYKPDGTPTNGWFHGDAQIDFYNNVWDESLEVADYSVEF